MAGPAARVYVRLLRLATRGRMSNDALVEAATVFAERRHRAWQASVVAWLTEWLRESRSLVHVRRESRRDDATTVGPSMTADARRSGVARVLEHLTRDVMFGARQLVRQPVFAAVAVCSVALGMAGSIVVFTAANAVLWRPLAGVAEPEQVVALYYGDDATVWSYPDFEDALRDMPALADATAYSVRPMVAQAGDSAPRELMGARVGPNYFQVLGTPLVLGRGFGPDDPDDVAVIGEQTWVRDYARAPDVVGRTIDVRGRPHTIVGVAPGRLLALAAPIAPQVYVPVTGEDRTARGSRSLDVVGRLAEGATLDQARAEAEMAARRLFDASPELHRTNDGRPLPIQVASARNGRISPQERLTVLGGVFGALAITGLILLVATTNLANMVLTQGLRRQAELGVRRALGAGRKRLVAQLVTESVLVAVLAAALAFAGVQVLARWLAAGPVFAAVPAGIDLGVDWRVAAFAAGVALLAGVFVGFLPALHVTRVAPLDAMRRGSAMGPRRLGLRRLLVTAQLAGSFVLVVVALLFARSLTEAQKVDLGFDPEGVTVLRLNLGDLQYTPEAAAPEFDELLARAATLPGVEGAAVARLVPLGGSSVLEVGFEVEGYDAPAGQPAMAGANAISPGYFRLLRQPMVAGREFTPADASGGQRVVIVNESFVRRFWPDGVAVGRRVGDRLVVGVVADAKFSTLSGSSGPFMWQPVTQFASNDLTLHVRATADQAAIASAVDRIASDVVPGLITRAEPMTAAMANALLLPRILSRVFAAAGLLALALAALGVYGVMSYVVGARAREMGIRLALGASPRRLLGLIMREGMALSAIGFGLGLALAVTAAFLLRSMLVGLSALDPMAIGGGVVVLGTAAALACYLPARRAARVDPVESLRAE